MNVLAKGIDTIKEVITDRQFRIYGGISCPKRKMKYHS